MDSDKLSGQRKQPQETDNGVDQNNIPDSVEKQQEDLLKEYNYDSIEIVKQELEDAQDRIIRYASRPKLLKEAQDEAELLEKLLKKHAQLGQSKILAMLQQLGFQTIDQAIVEKQMYEERLANLPASSIKNRRIAQEEIDNINEILKLLPNQFIVPPPGVINLPPIDPPHEPIPDISTLFEREKEDAQNNARFILSAPGCFEKSVKILTHILFQKLDNKIEGDDEFIKVDRSQYNELIHIHLENIKTTFVKEVMKNSDIMTKVNSLQHPNDGNVQQYETILKCLQQIQPLTCKFNFEEFFAYIDEAEKVSSKLANSQNKIIVLLLGTTGAGKSTTIHYVCGSEMYETQNNGLKHIEFRNILNQDLLKVKVSPFSRSETRYITPIEIDIKLLGGKMKQVITLVDTPGLFDLKNAEVDVSNQIGIVKALQQVESIRPFIVFSYKRLGARGEGLKEILNFYAQMILNSEYIEYFNFFFSHVDKDVKIENLTARIENILQELNPKEKSNTRLVKFLEVIIQRAEEEKLFIIDPLNRQEILKIITQIAKTEEIPNPSSVFQKVICDESNSKIIEQFDLHQRAIISNFKKANGNRVDFLLNQLKNFCKIMDSNQDYKQKLIDILKNLNLRINKNYDEVVSIFAKSLIPGNKITEQDIAIYQRSIQFSSGVEDVRLKYLQEIGGNLTVTRSNQDIEKEVERLIRNGYKNLNEPQPAKLDSQNFQDYLQKLEFLANSEIQNFVSIRKEIFDKISIQIKDYPKRATEVLLQILSLDQDGDNKSVSQIQQNNSEESKNLEELYKPVKPFDEFAHLMKELEKAEQITKNQDLKKVIKHSIESIVDILKKKFDENITKHYFEDFQELNVQNINNLCNLTIEQLDQQVFRIRMDESTVNTIQKYYQFLECFIRSMISNGLSQIEFAEGKLAKFNEQIIFWYSVQEEKLKLRISQDRNYSAIKSIYDEIMLVKNLPGLRGQAMRQQRIKQNLTKLVTDKTKEAQKYMFQIKNVVNKQFKVEEGKSKDNQQINFYTLVQLKEAIRTIKDLKWTIENGNEDIWDDLKKDLAINLEELVKLIQENVKFTRDETTSKTDIAETEQAFKQISEIQSIADILKIELPDINIEEFKPEIENNLNGAEKFFKNKGMFKLVDPNIIEENKIENNSSNDLLKKSECEKFFQYYNFLNMLRTKDFMIKKIDEISAKIESQSTKLSDKKSILIIKLDEFIKTQMEKVDKEFKKQLKLMGQYLENMKQLSVDDEGFYKNKDHETLAAQYLNEFLVVPVDNILSIFKMIREMKLKNHQLWNKLSQNEDYEEQFRQGILKFYKGVEEVIAMARQNQVTITNGLKIIKLLIPLDIYFLEQNEKDKKPIFESKYDELFKSLVNYSSQVVTIVQKHIEDRKYDEIKGTLVTLQQLDGIDQQQNMKSVKNLLHSKCNELCLYISKEIKYLVREKQLDDEKTAQINEKSQELSDILKIIGPRFLDEKTYKWCNSSVMDVQEKMSADLNKIIDYIRNKIISQSFAEAYESIDNYSKSIKNTEIIYSTNISEGQTDLKQKDYVQEMHTLSEELFAAIEGRVKDFEILKNTSLNTDEDSVLEKIIEKSPKELTENLQNSKNEKIKKYSEGVIKPIQIIFQEKILILHGRIGVRGENGQEILQKINRYLKICRQLPKILDDEFNKKIEEIKNMYIEGQKKESDEIKAVIESIEKKPSYVKDVFERLDIADFSLDPKCKKAFNDFYKIQSDEAFKVLIQNTLEECESKLYELWLFQSHGQIRTQFVKENYDSFELQKKIIGDVYSKITKGIEDIFFNRNIQNKLSVKVLDQHLYFNIEKFLWYHQLFESDIYNVFAKELLPKAGEELIRVIDLGTIEIKKYSEEFKMLMDNEDPEALTLTQKDPPILFGVFKIIQIMRNIKHVQDLFTKIDFEKILEASNIPNQSEKIGEFLKFSEYANYQNFCKLFYEKQQKFIENFDQPEFFTLDDYEITKTTDERKNYYKQLRKYFIFLQGSHDVQKELPQDLVIDPKEIQLYWEQKITDYHEEISAQVDELLSNLMDSVQLSEINKSLDDLFLLEENFKFIDSKNFDDYRKQSIQTMKDQAEEIMREIQVQLQVVDGEEQKSSDILQSSKLAKPISKFITQLKDISLNVSYIKSSADQYIKLTLACLKKNSKDQSIISEIATLLKQSAIGSQIIDEEEIFLQEARTFWAKKIQNQNIDYVLEHLETNNKGKLSLTERDKLKKEYNSFEKKYAGLVEKYIVPYSEIPDNLRLIYSQLLELTQKEKQEDSKFTNITKNRLYELLAYLFAFWTIQDFYDNKFNCDGQDVKRVQYLKKPQPAQVISIFRMLGIGYDDNTIVQQDQKQLTKTKIDQLGKFISKNAVFDNLVQIKTGEGKSVTLAMTIAVFALWDFEVSCACYSEYLSERDFDSFKPLFEFLKITEKIFYGTFNQICERYINKDGDIRELTLNRILKDSPILINKVDRVVKRVILIDEVDVFFSGEFFNKMYAPVAQIKNEHVTRLLDFMWNNRDDKTFSFRKFKQQNEVYKNCAALFKPEFIKVFDEACKDILGASRDFKHNYVVKNGKIGYQEIEQVSFTKSEGYKTIFAHYYHNEIPAKDGSFVTDDNLKECKVLSINCGQFSYAEIPLYSMLILGVSGTLESLTETEKEIIQNIFQIRNFTFMPSVYGESKLKWKMLDPLERTSVKSQGEYFNDLSNEIKGKLQGGGDQRSVIVFFKTLEDLNSYKKSDQYQQLKCQKQELTDLDNLEDNEKSGKGDKITKATHKNTLTLTTRSFGRGTDFICRDEIVETNGGVHVILTFVPEMNSEFIQIQGRTARQGNKGSFQMILLDTTLECFGVYVNSQEYKEEYKDKLDYIFKKRDIKIKEAQKSDANEVATIKNLHNESLKIKKIITNYVMSESESKDLCQYLVKINLGPNVEESANPVKTLILMDATGSMGSFITQAKNSVNLMYERSGKVLEGYEFEPNLNMIQFACYRNYSCPVNLLLQSSGWESKPSKLKAFMDKIGTDGGMGNEAVEVGFQLARREAQDCKGIPLRQIYLIGDIGPNTKDEVDSRRNQYPNWKGTQFEEPAYWETELDLLKDLKVQVNTFYVHLSAKKSFEEIASRTGGTCTYLDLSKANSQEILLGLFVPKILEVIGEANGDVSIGKKMVAEYLKCYK